VRTKERREAVDARCSPPSRNGKRGKVRLAKSGALTGVF
jgi:hypothetical protein